MSKNEKRFWGTVAIFLFTLIVAGFIVVNARITEVDRNKADTKYVNITVLSKYDTIMFMLNDIKDSLNSKNNGKK